MQNSPLPTRLREARKISGLSQKELGIRAGIDEFSASPRINQYETGKHSPNYSMVVQLSNVLNVPPPYFFCEEDKLAKLILIYWRLGDIKREKLLATLDAELSNI